MIRVVMNAPQAFRRHLALASGLAALMSGLALAGTAGATEAVTAENHNPTVIHDGQATDGPGKASPWAYAAKQGIGAAYEAYKDGQYSDQSATGTVSRVWFSLANGMVTETMYGQIHEAQIRELKLAVTGKGWTAVEGEDTTSRVEYIDVDAEGRPLSPAYRLINRDRKGRFVIIKEVFTDPDHQSLMLRVTLKPLVREALSTFVILDPSLNNTSGNDEGKVSTTALDAFEGTTVALSLRASQPFVAVNVGYTGVTDGLDQIRAHQTLGIPHADTGGVRGNIVMVGQLPPTRRTQTLDLALGFGATTAAAEQEAAATLKTGHDEVLARYNGTGARIGWEDYLDSLTELKSLIPFSADHGRLLYASALTLKVQEDRTHAGALIASLSNPWGDTVYATQSSTGYKGVWPRDFYQVAMALAALGDRQTPVAAFNYLPTIQVRSTTPGNSGATGWFQQKSHVDGTPEWVGVQLDQTAMPILLGARLEALGLISKAQLKAAWTDMLKPAAEFLTKGGTLGLDWNHAHITPPYSQQERWEEQEGYSPSTTAAVIAGLAAASDLAAQTGDAESARTFRDTAEAYSAKLEARLYTTSGQVSGKPQSYYLRISRSEDANNPGIEDERNGHKGLRSDLMIDAGFLELVRYGVRRADDPRIASSLKAIDDQTLSDNLRVRYDFRIPGQSEPVPGFRRYGNDGYGDTLDGHNYVEGNRMDPAQRGRVWPIFTGERGHYELALAARHKGGVSKADIARIKRIYVAGMEHFANQGLMLPEQVFDGVGQAGLHGYVKGQGTDSATPLAWTHAEYIKLLRSLRDRQVWDRNETAFKAFAKK